MGWWSRVAYEDLFAAYSRCEARRLGTPLYLRPHLFP